MYAWAFNKVKLSQAIQALNKRKELDPRVEINEETIKAEYIRRAGLVVEATIPESEVSDDEFVEEKPKRTRKAKEE